MKALPWILAASVLLPAASAASEGGFVTLVAGSDADSRVRLETLVVFPGYVDANGNGLLDYREPDETLYLDQDASGTVTFNDLRLTGFFTYSSGSAVDYTNRDFGRTLSRAPGWFAHDGQGSWYLDTDGDERVSAGDARLVGSAAGSKVAPGDAAVGTALVGVQEQATQALRVGWSDANANQRRDVGEAVYVDLNFDKQVSPGDLRVRALGLGLDDEPTRGEFEAAVAALEAQDAALGAQIAAETAGRQQADAGLAADIDALAAGLRGLADDLASWTTWLLVLGTVALVAALGAAWYARKLFRSAAEPRPAPVTRDSLERN